MAVTFPSTQARWNSRHVFTSVPEALPPQHEVREREASRHQGLAQLPFSPPVRDDGNRAAPALQRQAQQRSGIGRVLPSNQQLATRGHLDVETIDSVTLSALLKVGERRQDGDGFERAVAQ